MKKIEQEKNRPAANLPYQTISKSFRCQYIIPLDESIEIQQDANGVCYLRAKGGSLDSLVAGDNIKLTKTDDGKIIISAVDTATDIAAGQNITIDIDPDTGTAVINSITGGANNEHYKGVFDTAGDLIAFDTDPEIGDYGMIKQITYSDGGETTWNGQYKYCFYINGLWTVVDQMLTFTDDIELLQQFYSVGGSSPVIYLHKIAQTGSFNDLRDVPIVATPVLTVEGDTLTATCDTEGAEIWYTTDGTMPHVNGNKYTGPITVTEATTFRFVGIKNGMINSMEATVGVDYQLQPPTIELDWHDGTITMSNPNQSGTIYYTTDGSTPTNASNSYTGPFSIDEATLFKLVVINGGNQSSVTEQQYMQAHPVTNFSYAVNFAFGRADIRFSNSDEGEAHYEMYDSIPTYDSPLSQGSLTFPYYDHENPRHYSVRVFKEGKVPSIVARSPQNGKQKPTAPEISFDPDSGLVSINRVYETLNIQLVKALLTSGCTIRYTIDGSTPTADSLVYNGPFQISGNVTVKAVLIAYGQYYSDVASEEISIVAAPVITLDSEVGDISITGPAGATIYYTRDGSTPTLESTRYTMPINVMNSAHEEIRAIAVLSGRSSAMTVAEFQGLSWRDNGSVDVDYTSGVVTITPKIAADGATLSYGIGSDGGYPGSYYVYRNPVTLRLFDTDGKRVFFKQQKYGYIPNIYEADFTTQVSVDDPEIIYDENTGKATIALDGNTADIPLYTTTNLPALGARIYYTTDGTTPSAENGTMYDGVSEIPVSVGEMLKAMTECYGEYDSEVNDWARTPKISVDSMTGLMTIINPYGSQTRYTLDGSTPTRYSTLYSDPVDVSVMVGSGKQSLTIKAAAFENNVSIAVSELTMPVVAIEQIAMLSMGPGVDDGIGVSTYIAGVDDVSIFTSRWFRTGGGLPDDSGLIETWNQTGINAYRCEVFDTVSAFGHSTQVQYLTRFCQDGYIPLVSVPLQIGFDTPDAPSINYNDTAMTATFARTGNTAWIPLKTDNINPEQGCRIYYTLDGSTPTDQSTLWDGNAVQCQAGDLIKAICVCYGQYASGLTVQNVYVPESALSDDDVANIVKNLTTGEIRYVPQASFVRSELGSNYVEKDWMRQERNRDGISVLQHKTGIGSAKYATDNLYKIYCDTTANGGFTLTAGKWGATTTQTVAWAAGDSLDSIVAQLTSTWDATFAHIAGEDFIRLTACQSSSSHDCTLANNTGGTVVDLSKQCRVGGVVQAENHRVWQGTDLHTLFPGAGIPAANSVQYAKSGLNLSYRCGGNLDQFMYYYEVSGSGHGGVDTYLAEDSISARMSRVGFASCNGSSNPDAQALYDKYSGSWQAYMEASMIYGESTNANGIVDQTYSVADTVSPFLASVETVDFAGNWIPAFPIFYNAYQVVDDDFGHGIVGSNHDMSVYMNANVMAQLNAGGCNISRTAYYWSFAQCNSSYSWFYNGDYGTVGRINKCYGYIGARVLAYKRPS